MTANCIKAGTRTVSGSIALDSTPPLVSRLGGVGLKNREAKGPPVELNAKVPLSNLTVIAELSGAVVVHSRSTFSVCCGRGVDNVGNIAGSNPSQRSVLFVVINSMTPEPDKFPIWIWTIASNGAPGVLKLGWPVRVVTLYLAVPVRDPVWICFTLPQLDVFCSEASATPERNRIRIMNDILRTFLLCEDWVG